MFYQVTVISLMIETLFRLLNVKILLWVVVLAFQSRVNLSLTPRKWAPHFLTIKVLLKYFVDKIY